MTPPTAGLFAGTRLDRAVRIPSHFHRSIHLVDDWSRGGGPESYLVTGAIREIAATLLDELGRAHGTRAWTLTGPYGAGKSAFLLFLADLLSSPTPRHPEATRLREERLPNGPLLEPVLLQAGPAPLIPRIAEALVDAKTRCSGKPHVGPANPTGEECCTLLDEAAEASRGGLLVVVDELGKYLEHAAATPGEDIFFLQQLAEAAARSRKPVVFVGALHAGFSDYLGHQRLGSTERAEWQKVQGRFRDLPFALPTDQALDLLGQAVEVTDPELRMRLARQIGEGADRLVGLGAPATREALEQCAPLHPVTALLLWPLFRSKAAQNERSLFAFLTSHEPWGFREFLARERVMDDEQVALYRVDQLHDYLSTALGAATFTGTDARRWALIASALERIPADAPPLARRIVKTVGLMSLYGEGVGLRASREGIETACDDCSRKEVAAAIKVLTARSILLWRRHRDAYGLWEGSDIALDEAFEQFASERLDEPLHERLRRVSEPRALVARRHSAESGTLRHFEVRLASPETAAKEAARPSGNAREPEPDGIVLFLLSEDGAPPAAAETITAAQGGRPVIAAIPQVGEALSAAVAELDAWRRVRDAVPALQGDPAALREVRAQEHAARERLEAAAGPALGLLGHILHPSLSRWFAEGEPKEIGTSRELQKLLSDAMDAAYDQAPTLRNELLNRRKLSSAAAAGRRNLIAAITDGPRRRLGIEGFPPAYSMFASLVEAGGFLRERDGEWSFTAPTEPSWKPAWKAIRDFVAGATDAPRPVTDLRARLADPPIGLRDGPFPVLLALYLATEGAAVALYEEDVFVPDAGIEALERLLRRPETFAMRSFRLPGEQRRIVEAAAAALGIRTGEEPGALLVQVTRRLVGAVARLPRYSRNTRGVSSKAQRVRAELLTARDPWDLVLRDLPEALAVELAAPGAAARYARRLAEAVNECRNAFPGLLQRIADALAEALRVSELREAERLRELIERARELEPHVADDALRRLLRAILRAENAAGDWRAVVALPLGGGLPADRWNDEQAEGVVARLRLFGLDADRITELLAHSRSRRNPTLLASGVRRLKSGSTEDLVKHLDLALDPSGFSQETLKAAFATLLERRERDAVEGAPPA